MLRPTLIASLVALPLFFAPAAAPVPASASDCPNTVVHEPIVMFDVSGSTLGGPVDVALSIYNDGTARISSIGQLGLPSRSEVAFLPPEKVRQFLIELSAFGAGQLCDSFAGAPDVPISTLTVFRDATDARTHTFSWDVPHGAYATIQQHLQGFIQSTFPNF